MSLTREQMAQPKRSAHSRGRMSLPSAAPQKRSSDRDEGYGHKRQPRSNDDDDDGGGRGEHQHQQPAKRQKFSEQGGRGGSNTQGRGGASEGRGGRGSGSRDGGRGNGRDRVAAAVPESSTMVAAPRTGILNSRKTKFEELLAPDFENSNSREAFLQDLEFQRRLQKKMGAKKVGTGSTGLTQQHSWFVYDCIIRADYMQSSYYPSSIAGQSRARWVFVLEENSMGREGSMLDALCQSFDSCVFMMPQGHIPVCEACV